METVLIFPNTLFEDNKLVDEGSTVYLIEHPVFFTKFRNHKKKLVLHRATMKFYDDYLRDTYKCVTHYINFDEDIEDVFKKADSKEIHMFDPVDHTVMKGIKSFAKKHDKEIVAHNTPLFMSKLEDLKDYKDKHDKYSHDNFYKWQRKRFNILMKDDGKKPKGEKWSFDVKNRKPFPKDSDKFKEDDKKNYIPSEVDNKYVKEAKKYVKKHFKDNPGNLDHFWIPVEFSHAKRRLTKFMKERFECYGPYQDAVNMEIPFGCHSTISPVLNVGLLTPDYVVERLEEHGIQHHVPMQSVEGIIRQIIGWREYIRMLYMFERKSFEKKNHFKHLRKLDDYWFEEIKEDDKGTGFKIIDDMINKTVKWGYLHHIERLMYIGNFMLITETYPEDSFKWFMEMFVDSYQWVMYPNVYGMSQYSAGPIMMTRPYFSSSNYINKMSGYKKHKDKYQKIKLGRKDYEWFQVWDALYYNFISENKDEFSENYATARQVTHWDNKSDDEQEKLKDMAKSYFEKY